MTNAEAVNWLINITADIGKTEHQELWHYEQALTEIREMLETEPQRKRGNWNKCGDMGVFWQCSECGMVHTTPFSFCPDCGADMRGVVTE